MKRTSSAPDFRSGKFFLNNERSATSTLSSPRSGQSLPTIEKTSTAFQKMQMRISSSQESDEGPVTSQFLKENTLTPRTQSTRKKEMQHSLKESFIQGDKQAAIRLVEKGANVNYLYNGKTLLHFVAEMGQEDNANFLIQTLKAKVDKPDYLGFTPFHYACLKEHTKLARKLVNFGADPKKVDSLGRTALHHACIKENRKTASFLVQELNIEMNAKDKQGFTALHSAIFFSSFEMCKLLAKELKADVNVKCEKGRTPLHYALFRGRAILASIMVYEFGADPSLCDLSGRHALHYACTLNNPYYRREMSRFLIQYIAKKFVKEHPLYEREIQSHDLAYQKFLSYINAPDVNGITPLEIATRSRDSDLTELLLSFGANPNFLKALYS